MPYIVSKLARLHMAYSCLGGYETLLAVKRSGFELGIGALGSTASYFLYHIVYPVFHLMTVSDLFHSGSGYAFPRLIML